MLGSAPTWSDPTKRTTKLKNLDMVLVEKNHTDWPLLLLFPNKFDQREQETERVLEREMARESVRKQERENSLGTNERLGILESV